jgi:exopolyphosphatase/guanosine-5'-triphosphate,3'-diphosphate pyrophosphatase
MSIRIGIAVPASSGKVTTIAAIDIGSNSIHLIVARMDKAGQLEVLDTDKIGVRLGEFLLPDGNMSIEGFRRALSTVSHMAKIASAYGAAIRAVATHSLREAKNHQQLIDEISKKTGVKVEIIDGVEEARLVFLGMRYALPVESTPCLGVDIGGGSTEIILARGEQVKFVTSLKLGAVTLTAKHFKKSSVLPSSIKKMHEYINLRLLPLAGSIKKGSFKRAIASSGTAKTLAIVHSRFFRKRILIDENGYRLPSRDLRIILAVMERLKSPKKIREILGVDSSRADIIMAGAAVMNEVSKVFGVQEWTISSYGLREGIVVDSYRRMSGDRAGRARDIRWDSVRSLAEQWHVDEKYAGQVSSLALDMFDKLAAHRHPSQVKSEWLGDRELLQVAAWLHEAGKFIAQSSYHRHTYYLINNGRISGFTQDERHLIALVALHHRKASPKFDQGELVGLHKRDFERVEFLAGILRLAVALNRSRRGIVKELALKRGRMPELRLVLKRGSDPTVELQQVEREREALEKAIRWHFVVDYERSSMRGLKRRSSKKKAVKIKKSSVKLAERLLRSSGQRHLKKA